MLWQEAPRVHPEVVDSEVAVEAVEAEEAQEAGKRYIKWFNPLKGLSHFFCLKTKEC